MILKDNLTEVPTFTHKRVRTLLQVRKETGAWFSDSDLDLNSGGNCFEFQ